VKLEKWASIAEIASGIAVVITLLIRFAGVRENTEITRTAMYADALDQFNALETEILLDPDLLPIYYRYSQVSPWLFRAAVWWMTITSAEWRVLTGCNR